MQAVKTELRSMSVETASSNQIVLIGYTYFAEIIAGDTKGSYFKLHQCSIPNNTKNTTTQKNTNNKK
jgi:hypothetical protein